MKNEQAAYSGTGMPAPIQTPVAALSTVGGVCKGTRPPARCTGGKAGQKEFLSTGGFADGFLRHQFLPRFAERPGLPEDTGITKGVLNSLCLASGHLPFTMPDVSDKAYPYNILLAHWSVQQQLRRRDKDAELFIVADEQQNYKIATKQTAKRSYSLYYIPVLPLYRLLQSREDKQGAKLLLSVFSYLYHIARIPYYRDEDTFLFYHYEIMEEWLTEEDGSIDQADLEYNRRALHAASHGGDVIGRIIYNLKLLQQFGECISATIPANTFETACLKVAETAFNLWRDFPEGHLFNHLHDNNENDEDDEADGGDYDNTIRVDEYVHFIADTESSLYDSLQQNIDAELNEKMYWQEHALFSVYDDTFSPLADTLDYENRLFRLLDELAYLLNELP